MLQIVKKEGYYDYLRKCKSTIHLFMGSFDYSIKYQLQSTLGEETCNRFINNYTGEIIVDQATSNIVIGRIHFSLILTNQVREKNFDMESILQTTEQIKDFTDNFIDMELLDFNDLFLDKLTNPMLFENICLITKLELLPGFRGRRIGAKIIKDLHSRFSYGISLFVAKAVPFQITMIKNRSKGRDDDKFYEEMNFEDTAFDEETAQLKINAFFQRLGFNYFTKGYFFLDNRYAQEKINAIEW